MSTPSFDQNEMLRAAELLIEPGAVTELRALDAQLRGQQRTGTVSGYFDSPAKLVDAAARIVAAKGIYIVANPVKPELLARAANRVRLVNRGEPLTADHDVPQRRWLLIDVDPQRPAGISSTRQTELMEIHPTQTVCAWLGNSEKIALSHYAQVRDVHFEAAAAKDDLVARASAAAARVTQKAAQQASETPRKAPQVECSEVAQLAILQSVTNACEAVRMPKVTPAGFEPASLP